MPNARNNVIAGVFVLLGVALAVWVSFLLSDRSAFQSTTTFAVRFPLDTGAAGLKRGSEVLLGGQPVGRVLAVDFARNPDSTPAHVDVEVEVRDDLPLFTTPALASKPCSVRFPSTLPYRLACPPARLRRCPRHSPVSSILGDAGFGPD